MSPTISQMRFDQLEDYYPDEQGWGGAELLQLSAGNFRVVATTVNVGDIDLLWHRFGASVRLRDQYLGDNLVLAMVAAGPRPVHCLGHELSADHAALWWAQSDQDYVIPAGLRTLEVHVPRRLVDHMGWDLRRGGCVPLTAGSTARLVHHCWAMTTRAATSGASPVAAALWQDRLLAEVDLALAPCLHPAARGLTPTRYFRNVEAAMTAFHVAPGGSSHTVDELAARIGVSRRTLFRSFRQALGLSPLEYLRLTRLHALRERLLSAQVPSIISVAGEYRFSHMGRLALAYHEHFGERPSETLRRGRARSS